MPWVDRPDGTQIWVPADKYTDYQPSADYEEPAVSHGPEPAASHAPAAQPEKPGLLKAFWEALNTPASDYVSMAVTGKPLELSRRMEEEAQARELAMREKTAAGLPGGDPGSAALQSMADTMATGTAKVLEGFTSPVGILTAGAASRATALAKLIPTLQAAGRTAEAASLAKELAVLRGAEAAAGGAFAVEGGRQMVEGPDLASRLTGAATLAGGLAGVAHGALGGAGAAERAIQGEDLRPGGTPMDVSEPAAKAAGPVAAAEPPAPEKLTAPPGPEPAGGVPPEPSRVSQLKDPIDEALNGAVNLMFEHINELAPKNRLAKVGLTGTPLEGDPLDLYAGYFASPKNAPTLPGVTGLRLPRWLGGSGRLAISRPSTAVSVLLDASEKLGMHPADFADALIGGRVSPAIYEQLAKTYRENLQTTIAHEMLHGFKGSVDSMGAVHPDAAIGVPARQMGMDASALQLLETPDAKGVTMKQKLAAWMEPGSPATQAAWTRDFVRQLSDGMRAEYLSANGIQLGLPSIDAAQMGDAFLLQKRTGSPIDTLPDELKTKLRLAMSAQREGRAAANQKRTILRAKQADVVRKWNDAVDRGEITHLEAQQRIRDEMAQTAGIDKVAYPQEFTGTEPEQLMAAVKERASQSPDIYDTLHAGNAMEKMIRGDQLTEGEMGYIRQAFGRKVLGQDPTWFERWFDVFGQLHGTLRAAMTSMDVSAVLRQALIPTISHPGIAAKSLQTMFKGMWTKEAYSAMEKSIFDPNVNPFRTIQDAAGLHLSQPGGGLRFVESLKKGGAEEMFGPSYASKLPWVKVSERAYILYLNKMRSDLFNKMSRGMMKGGITFEENPQVYKDLAHAINNLTGRGDMTLGYVSPTSAIGKAMRLKEEFAPGRQAGELAVPLLNSAFFAPRFMAARLAILRDLPLLYANYSAPVRNMMLRDVFTTIGTGLTVLAAASELTGAQLESDPRSSDFGKIRIGDTRYDPWGGFQPWVRFAAQMITGQQKSTSTRQVKTFKGDEKWGQVTKFLAAKASPGVSLATDVALGKPYGQPTQFLSDEFPYLGRDTLSRLTPIIAQDMYDLWTREEFEQMAVAAPLSALGVGVQTYSKRPPTRRTTP